MKWPQIIIVLVGFVSLVIAVRLRPEKPAPEPATATFAAAPPAIAEGRILPPSTEQPGVTSRLIGLLRTYVAVAEEIHLEPSVVAPRARIASVPILIVFENESYRPLTAGAMGWLGDALGSVHIARIPDRGAEIDVFETELPLPERTDWGSGERRSFTVDWPIPDGAERPITGLYKVSVRLALPDYPAIEIYTRLL